MIFVILAIVCLIATYKETEINGTKYQLVPVE